MLLPHNIEYSVAWNTFSCNEAVTTAKAILKNHLNLNIILI